MCWERRVREFSVHTDLFLALEKQDVQSGLYQPGRGRRSPCPQETVYKFLVADACSNFHAGGWGGVRRSGMGREKTPFGSS